MGVKTLRALYDILGVAKDATKDEIKTAYRKLANELHPDHNDGKENDEFIELTKSYKILIDNDKRKKYDESGYTGECVNDQKEVAISILINWVENCLNDEETLKSDVVKRLIAMSKADSSKCQYRLKSTSKRIKKLKKVIRRFKYKGKSKDFINMCIQNIINKLVFDLQQLQYQIEVDKLIIEILNDYDYRYLEDPDDPEDEPQKGFQPLGNIFDFAKNEAGL